MRIRRREAVACLVTESRPLDDLLRRDVPEFGNVPLHVVFAICATGSKMRTSTESVPVEAVHCQFAALFAGS